MMGRKEAGGTAVSWPRGGKGERGGNRRKGAALHLSGGREGQEGGGGCRGRRKEDQENIRRSGGRGLLWRKGESLAGVRRGRKVDGAGGG